jgi:hypothetical protein
LTKAGPADLDIWGVATYGDIDGLPGTTLLATDDATAQRLFAEEGRYDMVVAAADSDVTDTILAERVTSAVASDSSALEVLTGDQDTADKQADLAEDLKDMKVWLVTFSPACA